MKRWTVLINFLLFIGLCVSATFWTMQFLKPASRPITMPKQQSKTDIDPEIASGLFGGRAVSAAAVSNFQLKGVVVANNVAESIAILVADGKPAEALRINSEPVPGVVVREVHPQYVLLSENGVIKRVELPASAPQSRLELPTPIGMPPQAPAALLPASPQNTVGQESESIPIPPPTLPLARFGRTGRN